MRVDLPVEEKMRSEAEFGLFFLHHAITLKKAEELRKIGFEVKDMQMGRNSPRLHWISWKNAGVDKFDYQNIDNLDENDTNYSFAEQLWIISSKVQKSPIEYYRLH